MVPNLVPPCIDASSIGRDGKQLYPRDVSVRVRFRIFLGPVLLAFFFLLPAPFWAQVAGATLSGSVIGPSGAAGPGVETSIKNSATGQRAKTQTNLTGLYKVLNLAPWANEDSIPAAGSSPALAHEAPAEGAGQTMDLALSAEQAQQGAPKNPTPPANLPNAPSSNAGAPSLQDLGLTPNQVQGNAQEQARLDKRSHMLKVHQRLGLITAIPLVATLITGPQAKAKGKNGQTIKEPTSANLDFHTALGGVTVGLYAATAYYAIFAPKIEGTQARGPIRLHRALAWVHGPGMILTPILGVMAFNQENNGEKVHGIASAHGTVAYVTAIAYGAAIVSASWPIKLKF